jgi:hypothetical protein
MVEQGLQLVEFLTEFLIWASSFAWWRRFAFHTFNLSLLSVLIHSTPDSTEYEMQGEVYFSTGFTGEVPVTLDLPVLT